jgi:hypothetical protein
MLNDDLEKARLDSGKLAFLEKKLNEFFTGLNEDKIMNKANQINLKDLEMKDTQFWREFDKIKIDLYICKNESTTRILNS